MGRKKKRQQQRRTVPKPKRQNAETGGPVAKAARLAVGDRLDGSRRRLTSGHVAALVVLSLVCGAAALVARFAGKAADDFPAAMASAPAENQPTIDDFVGADGWRECHAQQYEAWRESVHGKAGGPPSNETVIAPFDGTPIRFADAMVTPIVNEAGQYQFVVSKYGEDQQTFTVAGVIGGGYMQGGGTQGFVTGYADGTIRFLPFDYIKQEGVWFCSTNSRTDEG